MAYVDLRKLGRVRPFLRAGGGLARNSLSFVTYRFDASLQTLKLQTLKLQTLSLPRLRLKATPATLSISIATSLATLAMYEATAARLLCYYQRWQQAAASPSVEPRRLFKPMGSS